MREEAETGTSPEPLVETEVLLQEIAEIAAAVKNEKGVNNNESQKKERARAMAVRDVAMKTWAKGGSESDGDNNEAACTKPQGGRGRKRRRGSDALQYLEVKSTADAEVKREELALCKQQLELRQIQAEQQQERQEQLQLQMQNQQQHLQQQEEQQQRQFMQQQQQFQQQMQTQTQTQNLILAMIRKMTGQ